MAYRDPYAGQTGRYPTPAQTQPPYAESVPDFNPYANTQPHETYHQGDEGYNGGYRDDELPSQPSQQALAPAPKERSEFNDFSPTLEGRTPGGLRRYRYETQGALWTRGGRGRCVGRFCCCTLMIAVFLIVSIVLSLALWIRPPNIIIGDVQPATNGSTIQLQSDGLSINLGVNISVSNPNYFSASFKHITAQIFYPINETDIGGGTQNDVVFGSHSQRNFTFPFTITYKTSLDPDNKILLDLATKCGILGTKSDIKVDYKITLGLRILFVTISPVVSNSFSFACPVDASDLEGLMKAAGIGA